ncbi:O-methyltransferase [Parasphingorhabdus cellanae]|uniref:O-methyltransferase n=1 Tax=Parasphingorhabdus cellanae TaxID=2806553 RepID=A0ABX7T3A3_9SPHN|nr:O-methyltransferase [Parasphingorhabdus cellanae]QTD56050.1 O-methyltransferase [Parasphingorhabdus cellanae]
MAKSDPSWSEVDDYIIQHLIGDDPVLDACLAANAREGLPVIDVSPAQGRMLELLARGVRAQRILEIGTLGGYSAIWLARALPDDGRLVSLELEPAYAAVARSNIKRAGLADKVEIIIGEAVGSLAALQAQDVNRFDFIFVDADKENYATYLDYAVQLSRPGTMLVFDNVVREGGVIDPASPDPKVPGTRELFSLLKNHPRVDATAIQTVGSKKWDGFLLGIVQDD